MLNHIVSLLVDNLVYWKFLPSPVLRFLSDDLVFWIAAMAAIVVVGELRTEPRMTAYRWLIQAAVTFVVSTGLFIVAHAIIYSPPASRNEPGVVYHPGSATSNSFPSHQRAAGRTRGVQSGFCASSTRHTVCGCGGDLWMGTGFKPVSLHHRCCG